MAHSQGDLAKMVGCTYWTISQIELGKSIPGIRLLLAMAAIFRGRSMGEGAAAEEDRRQWQKLYDALLGIVELREEACG